MNQYQQRQLESLEAFIARKRYSKEMATKRFMESIRQEADSSMFALVYCTVPVVLLVMVVGTIALIVK